MVKIKIINKSSNPLPEYGTKNSAGMDLSAFLKEPVILRSLERALIPTGLYIELPEGYEAQIRPRSGLALKNGISILNSPGTIDSDYRGEIGIIIVNLSDTEFEVKNGDRIGQMIISKHETISWNNVELLNDTQRGSGGFGHTGK